MTTNFEGPQKLNEEIDRVSTLLGEEQIGSEDYEKKLNALTKLWKIKADDKPDRISKDTLLIVGANILGILLVIRHEHVNVITSKAMSMVPKTRI
jgi:hypothetical protein